MKNENKTIKIEHLDTEKLVASAGNAKKHTDAQVNQIANSIKEFGFNNPVLVDENLNIIAGHGRVMAAKRIGMNQCPCIKLEHLSELQKRAYIIADNRLSETGSGWDEDLLKSELEDISNELDVLLTGFNLSDFEKKETDIIQLAVEKPPSLAWVLISVPIELFGKVQSVLDNLPEQSNTYTTYTDEKD